jgi:CysZ protein
MFEAAAKALAQMSTPPLRWVLLKSIGLALILIVLVSVGLQRLISWLADIGGAWAEGVLGGGSHDPVVVLVWVLSFAAGFGIVLGAIFLMPAVTAFVGAFFVDEVGGEVERVHYPDDPPGQPLPLLRAMIEGLKTALLAILLYLCAVPFLLFAGLGLFIMFFATSYLLGREYFLLAAMRFRPPVEAKAFRRSHRITVFVAGMFIAAFVSIPVVNLATPLFAMAFMVHMHKRLSAQHSTARRRTPAVLGDERG